MLTANTIQTMLPSDVERLAREIADPTVRRNVLDSLREFLGDLKEPGAVDLDDVAKIAMQIKSSGVWNFEDLKEFVHSLGAIDGDVFKEFCDVMNIRMEMEAAGPVAATHKVAPAQRWTFFRPSPKRNFPTKHFYHLTLPPRWDVVKIDTLRVGSFSVPAGHKSGVVKSVDRRVFAVVVSPDHGDDFVSIVTKRDAQNLKAGRRVVFKPDSKTRI